MSITSDLGSWAAIVGILLPLLVALLQRDHWGSTVNGIIFGVACAVAAVVYGWIRYRDNFSWKIWEEALLAIIVWGLATYHLYWKPSGQVAAARAIPPTNKPSV